MLPACPEGAGGLPPPQVGLHKHSGGIHTCKRGDVSSRPRLLVHMVHPLEGAVKAFTHTVVVLLANTIDWRCSDGPNGQERLRLPGEDLPQPHQNQVEHPALLLDRKYLFPVIEHIIM